MVSLLIGSFEIEFSTNHFALELPSGSGMSGVKGQWRGFFSHYVEVLESPDGRRERSRTMSICGWEVVTSRRLPDRREDSSAYPVE
jgi:hypothetical protein